MTKHAAGGGIESWRLPPPAGYPGKGRPPVRRQHSLVAEDLRNEIRVVAEGQQVFGRKLDSFEANVAHEFEETRALIRLSYGELDRRVRDLEGEVAGLRTRLDRVEERLAS